MKKVSGDIRSFFSKIAKSPKEPEVSATVENSEPEPLPSCSGINAEITESLSNESLSNIRGLYYVYKNWLVLSQY